MLYCIGKASIFMYQSYHRLTGGKIKRGRDE